MLLGHLRAERVVRREGQVWEEHPCGRKIRQAQRREAESVQALTLLCPATLNMNHARGAEKMPFPAVLRGIDGVACILQRAAKLVAQGLIVFDYKDTHGIP